MIRLELQNNIFSTCNANHCEINVDKTAANSQNIADHFLKKISEFSKTLSAISLKIFNAAISFSPQKKIKILGVSFDDVFALCAKNIKLLHYEDKSRLLSPQQGAWLFLHATNGGVNFVL